MRTGMFTRPKERDPLHMALMGAPPLSLILVVLQRIYPCKSEEMWYPSEGNIDKARLLWQTIFNIGVRGEK